MKFGKCDMLIIPDTVIWVHDIYLQPCAAQNCKIIRQTAKF